MYIYFIDTSAFSTYCIYCAICHHTHFEIRVLCPIPRGCLMVMSNRMWKTLEICYHGYIALILNSSWGSRKTRLQLSPIPHRAYYWCPGTYSVGIDKLMIEILWKSFLLLECDCDETVRSQISTCHDSWAVMTCAKLWPDWVIICHERLSWKHIS